MTVSETVRDAAAPEADARHDAIIIGAGISGMYQLLKLRELGLDAHVFEAGDGVGGTWYWNRYPGARFDSESYSYGYSFSAELLEEWEWSEHFAAQPETLRYCNFVADKFDLRKDITFGARVVAARWDDAANEWTVTLEDGRRAAARFLITAIGPLSVPTMPTIPGIERFRGEAFHTGNWPHEPVGFEGKRVGVIGTGATGVQTIQEVAKTVGHLTVFQRRPNYCAPLHNRPINEETQKRIKADYPKIFEACSTSFGAFIHNADKRKAMEISEEEREAFYEKLYNEPGFGIWMGNFRDVLVDEAANRTITDFMHRKIRARVNDPEVAEKLIPKDHGFGTRRVPLESGYYEVYNQDNVALVDIRENPIAEITETGIRLEDGSLVELDMIIYATGFNAVLGGFEKIAFEGRGGRTLKQAWAEGPKTFLGMQVAGFPNLLTLVGPHNAAGFCNIPRCIEQNVEWASDLLAHMQRQGLQRFEPTAEAVEAWTGHVLESGERMLFTKVDSWFMGINSNLEGRQQRTFLLYAAGAPQYKERCDAVAEAGYAGMSFA